MCSVGVCNCIYRANVNILKYQVVKNLQKPQEIVFHKLLWFNPQLFEVKAGMRSAALLVSE